MNKDPNDKSIVYSDSLSCQSIRKLLLLVMGASGQISLFPLIKLNPTDHNNNMPNNPNKKRI